MQCKTCNLTFSNKEQIDRHIKICQRYKFITFTCKKCNFTCEGDIKIINSHIPECKEEYKEIQNNKENINEIVNEQIKEPITDSQINTRILELEKTILILETKLNIYTALLEKNTKIKTEQIFTLENEKIIIDVLNLPVIIKSSSTGNTITQLHNLSNLPINILPNDDIIIEEEVIDTTKIVKKKKGKNFRPLKETIIKSDVIVEKLETDLEKYEREKLEYINSYENTTILDSIFENCIEQISNNRNYSKPINDLCIARSKIFGKVRLEKYIEILNSHFEKIKEIFMTKKYNEKKLETVFKKGLTNLESRLLQVFKYYQLILTPDEINSLEKSIIYHNVYDKEFTIFDYKKLYEKFYNYGSVIIPIKKLLELYIINIYGFNSLVYIPIKSSTDDDPFSFYMLESIIEKTGKRKWSMISRLEDFANQITISLVPYLISIFRKLYKDSWGYNDYRKDYAEKVPLLEYDCEQLAQNILFIANPNKLRKFLCKLVKDKATYLVNKDNDAVNLYGDDPLQKKRLKNPEEPDLADVVKQMFDGINSEQAVDFYKIRVE